MIPWLQRPKRCGIRIAILLLVSISLNHGFVLVERLDVIGEAEPTMISIGGAATLDKLTGGGIRVYGVTDLDPGVSPGGDYPGSPVFTKDGEQILLTNRITDNVTVFDWATMTAITNVDVGHFPSEDRGHRGLCDRRLRFCGSDLGARSGRLFNRVSRRDRGIALDRTHESGWSPCVRDIRYRKYLQED